MNTALAEHNLKDAWFAGSGASSTLKLQNSTSSKKNKNNPNENIVNFANIDWREEFMKSMTYELSTVYAHKLNAKRALMSDNNNKN